MSSSPVAAATAATAAATATTEHNSSDPERAANSEETKVPTTNFNAIVTNAEENANNLSNDSSYNSKKRKLDEIVGHVTSAAAAAAASQRENSEEKPTKVPNLNNSDLSESIINSNSNAVVVNNVADSSEESVMNNVENNDENKNDDNDVQDKDVERFQGKIVYNPDGSAYIIENGEDKAKADEEALPVPRQEGSIVDADGEETDNSSSASSPAYPRIANAVYIRRSAAYYNALYGQACAKALREKMGVDAPIVHSYKVFSARDDMPTTSQDSVDKLSSLANTVPVKPILMCFICKLSFGYAKSFEGHCTGEHSLQLSQEEKAILDAKNSSAIIQTVGKDKQVVVSFLEPVPPSSAAAITTSPPCPPAATATAVPIPIPVPNQSSKDEDSEATAVEGKSQEGEVPSEQSTSTLSPAAIKGILSAALSQNAASLAAIAAASAASTASTPTTTTATPSVDAIMSRSLPLPFPLPLPPPEFGGGLPLDAFPLPLALRGPPQPSPLARGSGESPLNCPSPIPPGIPSNANMLQGTTIGACPEHVNGRQDGVDCSKCDLILNRLPGALGWNTARNSCKTLKCPKCNWHYKYQETLEIHMKEKHPENETTCIYCITGQQHPRLARGETYTCGYKPYRCEVCNYSTTTKGNLSIHMQSDKHLNNMQELQNGGSLVQSPEGPRISQSPVGRGIPPSVLAKQKPSWRCDICNYETNVARNLRIHMTSEKHTHNVMVLQQNVKHMQQMAQQAGGGPGPKSPLGLPGMFPGLPGLDPQQQLQMQLGGMGLPNLDKPPQQPEAAMADLAYLQAVMMQMMTGGQFPGGPLPPNFNHLDGLPGDVNVNPDNMEPPPEPADPNPKFLFSCCVCKEFGSDSIEFLSQHLTHDRTKIRENEVSIVIAGNFICKLCSYKTNLKANFQLHCKTDKHLQRLNHVNHIKEGGPSNEWKLKFLNVTNPVQLRCNACDYYTNSLHKLQLHIANQRHEISTILFAHLKRCEGDLSTEKERLYLCSLCKFSSPGKLLLMNHVRSMKHLQMEQIHQLQKRSEGSVEQTEIGDIFQVVEKREPGEPQQQQQAQNDNSEESGKDAANSKDAPSSSGTSGRPCPLCQEPFSEYSALEAHVTQAHSVNAEGLQRLLVLMEGTQWLNKQIQQQEKEKEDGESSSPSASSTATSPVQQQQQQHVSERHAYKYRCGQCSLAFKTAEKLNLHSQYHAIRDATRCRLCQRSFRTVQALLKHVESGAHAADATREELAHYKLGLMNHPLLLAGLAGQGGIIDLEAINAASQEDGDVVELPRPGSTSAEEPSSSSSSSPVKEALESLFNRAGGSMRPSPEKPFTPKKGLNYPLEKYLDPNRPYKCDVCKESFTQKNILLVHYNSVSHLHRLKKTMQDQQSKDQMNELLNKATPSSSSATASSSSSSSLEAAINNLRKDNEDEASKAYKCNICRVAYSQGSTLDIHIRSVLHQTRASKLQELAMMGQIDLSKPLIEQPDPKLQQEDQQRKLLTEMLSPKSLNSSSSSNPSQASPTQQQIPSPVAGGPSTGGLTPQSSPLAATLQQALGITPGAPPGSTSAGPKSLNELFAQQEQLQQQQQLMKILQSLPAAKLAEQSALQGALTEGKEPGNGGNSVFNMPDSKKSSHVLKNLLQNYGFELVMQFNEYHQRKKKEEEERMMKNRKDENDKEKSEEAKENNDGNAEAPSTSMNGQGEADDKNKDDKMDDSDATEAEIRRSKCPICKKEFSSIWVLKAHSEEIHKDVVPQEFLEKYVEELKSNLEKKDDGNKDNEDNKEEGKNGQSDEKKDEANVSTPEKNEELPTANYPETSTPKSGKATPVLSIPQDTNSDKSPSISQAETPSSTSKTPASSSASNAPPADNILSVTSAFQQALLAAQQQSQNINPMMLHLSQLQGMNPLVAMNLHPPLAPPPLFQKQQQQQQQQQNNSEPPQSPSAAPRIDPMMQMLLTQMQSSSPASPASSISTAAAPESPAQMLAASLGVDPKMLGDPSKLLPPPLRSPFPAPSSTTEEEQGIPKGLAQLRQTSPGMLPQAPDHKLLMHLTQMGIDPKNFAGQNPQAEVPKLPPLLGFPPLEPNPDPKALLMAQKPIFQQPPEQTKRARTRITDEQLKVLRSHFDITNSPTEEMINSMAEQTGLPHKVIKHWFRNTLFKERQRNKDSPYNFSNPPSTMLNLEEYEKTGEPKVIQLKPEQQKEYTEAEKAKKDSEKEESPSDSSPSEKPDNAEQPKESTPEAVPQQQEATESSPSKSNPATPEASPSPLVFPVASNSPIHLPPPPNIGSDGIPIPSSSSSSSPTPVSLAINSILSSQSPTLPKPPAFLPHPLVPNFPGVPGVIPTSLPSFLNPLAGMMSTEQPPRQRSPQPGGQGGIPHQGKRANRTRFTDYQIKVLQEFFENNAYPKDDDLEYLSKLLSLSPRVIVVWFQNARQKARKIYENQPPLDPNDDGSGRFTRTPGLNYQCKKCLLVFQRYYELIRHQKQHCFKEEDAKRSAQAQKAAAQAAAQFSTQQQQQGPSSVLTTHSEDSNSSLNMDRIIPSPLFNSTPPALPTAAPTTPSAGGSGGGPDSDSESNKMSPFRKEEETRKLTPSMFDQLASQATFPGDPPTAFPKFANFPPSNLFPNYPPTSPFGLLQQQALQASKDRDSDDLDNESVSSSPSSSTTKRKLSEDGETPEEKEESGQPRDKRLRTTILPEQLDYLYQKYQVESNPSRKMLEQIANEVGLRKRVVQVWFQNTRARERKGQFRAHQQVINKRCPFCPALFKVRSALESHLATKHSDQYTRGEINIDALPDAEGIDVGGSASGDEGGSTRPSLPGLIPPGAIAPAFPGATAPTELGESMRRYYEDTMKRYMNDLQQQQNASVAPSSPPPPLGNGQKKEGNSAMDLSASPALDLSGVRDHNDHDRSEERSECLSETLEMGEESPRQLMDINSPTSPASSSAKQGAESIAEKAAAAAKRFRTQMSNMQIKVMKSVFLHYKTPTMNECASLGNEIGLQKRVVQVWFQNARAKEKKARLHLQQLTGQEPENPPPPEECRFCDYVYTHKFVIQDHLFSKGHLDKIRLAIEESGYDPESPGYALTQAAALIQPPTTTAADNKLAPPSPTHTSGQQQQQQQQQLQMLQMAVAQGIRLPPPPTLPPIPTPEGNSNLPEETSTNNDNNKPNEDVGGGSNDNNGAVEQALMQQLYSQVPSTSAATAPSAAPAFPPGAAANPFLHPAMFSAASSGK